MKNEIMWNQPPTVVEGRTAGQAAQFLRSAKTGEHDFLDGVYERAAVALDLWSTRVVRVEMGNVKTPQRHVWEGYHHTVQQAGQVKEPPLLSVFIISDVETGVEMVRLTMNLETNQAHAAVNGPFREVKGRTEAVT